MRGLTLLLTSAVLLAGAPASAQEPAQPMPSDKRTPTEEVSVRDWARSQGNRIGLEMDFFGSSRDVVVSLTPVIQHELIPRLYLDAEVPLGLGFSSRDGGFLFGNPTIGAHYAANVDDDRIALFTGISVSVPLDPDAEGRADIPILLSYSRALYDAHRMAPGTLSIRERSGVEIRILRSLYYRGDISAVLYIPTGSNAPFAIIGWEHSLRGPTGEGEVGLFIEQGNELEARVPLGAGGGIRLQEVFTPMNEDLVQLAIEPFVSYDPPAPGLTMRLGFLVALDEELGFGLEEGSDKIATVRLAVGYKF